MAMFGRNNEFLVTPWEVKGRVDYRKLIEQFGTQELTDELLAKIREIAGELPIFLRRKFFFSHRDLDLVLQDYVNGKGFFLYTGRGPSGPMHIGHIVPFFFTKWLQDKFGVNLYIQLTDDEKFLFNRRRSLEDTKRYSFENMLDIIAVGFNPDKTFIFQNTEYPRIYDIAIQIAKKTTFSTVRAVFGFEESSNIGMIFFPAMQAAPTMLEKRRCLIPSAIDQDPYWRIQRDVAESLGYYKAAAIHSKFIPALTGLDAKMSASIKETAIYLTDPPKDVERKIFKNAFTGGQPTIKEQKEKGGNPNICVVFSWLEMFFEPNDAALKRRYTMCRNGELLCGECKQYLADRIIAFLEKHQEKREEARELVPVFKYYGELAREKWRELGLEPKK